MTMARLSALNALLVSIAVPLAHALAPSSGGSGSLPPRPADIDKTRIGVASSQPQTAAALGGVLTSALCLSLLSLSTSAWAADLDGDATFCSSFSATSTTRLTCARSVGKSDTTSDRFLSSSSTSILSAAETQTGVTGVADYLSKVFASPNRGEGNYNAAPTPTDPTYDSKEARNRAYDEAFERDARDRDAYYGRLAAEKRRKAEEDVGRYRRELGLDAARPGAPGGEGGGDVRPRVGDERVAGMASLREYLLRQDPATLTPEELRVYQRLQGEATGEATTTAAATATATAIAQQNGAD